MRRKRCRCCHELYEPDPRSYGRQKTCSKPDCREWRKRAAVRRWKIRNPRYTQGNPIKQEQWRRKHSGYWKEWRGRHANYVLRNRRAQRRRNAKNRGVIAKGNDIKWVCIDKLEQISALRMIAKGNDCGQIAMLQIDAICRYLKAQVLIAKGNEIDKGSGFLRE